MQGVTAQASKFQILVLLMLTIIVTFLATYISLSKEQSQAAGAEAADGGDGGVTLSIVQPPRSEAGATLAIVGRNAEEGGAQNG